MQFICEKDKNMPEYNIFAGAWDWRSNVRKNEWQDVLLISIYFLWGMNN